MSKERELLMRICKFLDSDVDNDYGLGADIKSLLSQPNEEKLTMTQRLEEYKKGYARAEQQLKREPLSDAAITELWANKSPINEFECTRLIEQAHGIGVENE